MPTPDELKRAEELYRAGWSQGKIAKELGKGKTTINRWLSDLGLLDGTDGERSGTKKATEKKKTFDLERRVELNDKFFERLEGRIDLDDLTPRDFKELMIAYGILEDKRQILEPVKPAGEKSGLAEMRDAMRAARKNDLEANPP